MTNPSDDQARVIADLARVMHDADDPDQTVRAMFEQVDLLLPSVTDTSITIRRRRGAFDSLGSSSDLAAEADRLQYEMHEGPCVEAAAPDGGGLYRSGDLRRDERWPTWGPKAANLGVASLMSITLLSNNRPFGAINMYARDAAQFTDHEEVSLARIWATHAAAALSAARVEANLHTAISARHAIGIAQGILLERYDLDTETSFRLLTRLASQLEKPVHDVASDIVRTGKIPQPD